MNGRPTDDLRSLKDKRGFARVAGLDWSGEKESAFAAFLSEETGVSNPLGGFVWSDSEWDRRREAFEKHYLRQRALRAEAKFGKDAALFIVRLMGKWRAVNLDDVEQANGDLHSLLTPERLHDLALSARGVEYIRDKASACGIDLPDVADDAEPIFYEAVSKPWGDYDVPRDPEEVARRVAEYARTSPLLPTGEQVENTWKESNHEHIDR